MYDGFFPIKKTKLNSKDLKILCVTQEIKRSSKRKQLLYHKFLTNRTSNNEREHEDYEVLFETITLLFQFNNKYETNIKRTLMQI